MKNGKSQILRKCMVYGGLTAMGLILPLFKCYLLAPEVFMQAFQIL